MGKNYLHSNGQHDIQRGVIYHVVPPTGILPVLSLLWEYSQWDAVGNRLQHSAPETCRQDYRALIQYKDVILPV